MKRRTTQEIGIPTLYDGKTRFSAKWIKWIGGCLESSTLFILVNGSPTEEFKLENGLRQGDYLTPFVFLIVVEGLVGVVT